MQLNKKIFLNPFVPLIVSILVFSFVYYEVRYSVSGDQKRLMSKLKGISTANVSEIIISEYELVPNKFEVKITKKSEILGCLSLLNKVDVNPVVGSNVYSVYKAKVEFVEDRGNKQSFLINVYNDDRLDVYFYDNFSVENNNGTFSSVAIKPVVVKGFAEWLYKLVPQGAQ